MNEYIDLWDKEWLSSWVKSHCKPKEVLDKERDDALQVATSIIKQKLDGYYKQGYTDKYVKLFYKAPWLFEKFLQEKHVRLLI